MPYLPADQREPTDLTRQAGGYLAMAERAVTGALGTGSPTSQEAARYRPVVERQDVPRETNSIISPEARAVSDEGTSPLVQIKKTLTDKNDTRPLLDKIRGITRVDNTDRHAPVVEQLLTGLAHAETGGVSGDQFSFHKPSGVALYGDDMGKWQVTEAELRENAKRFIGRDVSKKEFLANPDLQVAYMEGKIRFLLKEGLTPAQIAAVHTEGMTGYGDPAVLEKKIQSANKHRSNYVTRVLKSVDSTESK